MLIKFISNSLSCKFETGLFSVLEGHENCINLIRNQVKLLFSPVTLEDSVEKVCSKKMGGKFVNIKYISQDEEIGKIVDLPRGKILILPLKIAENDEKIPGDREVVNSEDGSVLFKIPIGTNIFTEYYLGIYLVNDSVEDDRGDRTLTGYVFYTQKGKNNIKSLVKELITQLTPGAEISIESFVTKKKIENFEGAVKSITYKTEVIPSNIAPDIDDEVKQSVSISVKTEIKFKSTNKLDSIKAMFPGASKKMFKKIIDEKLFSVDINSSEAKIGSAKIGGLNHDDNNDIIGIMEDYREIKDSEYTIDKFTQFCQEFFN